MITPGTMSGKCRAQGAPQSLSLSPSPPRRPASLLPTSLPHPTPLTSPCGHSERVPCRFNTAKARRPSNVSSLARRISAGVSSIDCTSIRVTREVYSRNVVDRQHQ